MRKNQWAIKHDLSRTRIYKIWIGMKARCYNKNSVPYPYYGAKGIRVCEEWKTAPDGFIRFYNWFFGESQIVIETYFKYFVPNMRKDLDIVFF